MKTIEDFDFEPEKKRKGKKVNRPEIDAVAAEEISALESGLSAPIEQWTNQKVEQLASSMHWNFMVKW